MQDSVLLIVPKDAGQVLRATLCRELDLTVEAVDTRRAGLHALRFGEWSAVLLDESLVGADPETTALLYSSARGAVMIETNLAITGATRIVRQVRAALLRRTHEQEKARSAAAEMLRGELRSTMSSLMLNAQLALDEVPPPQKGRLRHVLKNVQELHARLGLPL